MPPRALAPPPRVAPKAPEESADGLQFAWLFPPDGPARPLDLAGVSAALDGGGGTGVLWVHLNAAAVPAKQWLAGCGHLPEPIREDLLETDGRTRLEPLGVLPWAPSATWSPGPIPTPGACARCASTSTGAGC